MASVVKEAGLKVGVAGSGRCRKWEGSVGSIGSHCGWPMAAMGVEGLKGVWSMEAGLKEGVAGSGWGHPRDGISVLYGNLWGSMGQTYGLYGADLCALWDLWGSIG